MTAPRLKQQGRTPLVDTWASSPVGAAGRSGRDLRHGNPFSKDS